MSDSIVTRLNTAEDRPQLLALWQHVFGDDPALINCFLDAFGSPGNVMVTECGNHIVSAIYMLPLEGIRYPDGTLHPISLTYALATEPAYRGRGIGRSTMNAAIRESFRRGFDHNALWPAEDSLFPHYTRTSGYLDCFTVRELSRTAVELQQLPAADAVIQADAAGYNTFRNAYLDRLGILYIRFGERAVSYQMDTAGMYGGGCFLLGTDAPWGCFCCEYSDAETVTIRELLCPGHALDNALAQIAAKFPAASYTIRIPAAAGAGTDGLVRRCGQLQTASGSREFLACAGAYYGLAFD